MKVIERIRLVSPDQLENEITMIDPVAFTQPYKSTRTWTTADGKTLSPMSVG